MWVRVIQNMNKINFYKIGLTLGLVPIIGLGFILFTYWFGLAFFAHATDVAGIGFLYIMISVPIVLIGFVFTFISFLRNSFNKSFRPIIGLILIVLNIPALIWILGTYGEISSRAYLKVVNNSEKDIESITIIEPDNESAFGSLSNKESKIMYFNPDYKSSDGMTYPGIGENYFLIITSGNQLKKRIPIIHPGETHKIIFDKYLNLSSIHLNKI